MFKTNILNISQPHPKNGTNKPLFLLKFWFFWRFFFSIFPNRDRDRFWPLWQWPRVVSSARERMWFAKLVLISGELNIYDQLISAPENVEISLICECFINPKSIAGGVWRLDLPTRWLRIRFTKIVFYKQAFKLFRFA